jgi:hypothetical protein
MTDKKYRAYRIAYNRYPKETEFFGIGIVERVMRECGSENSASVFEKFWEYIQKRNWDAEGLQEIIDKNSRIKKKAKKSVSVTKPTGESYMKKSIKNIRSLIRILTFSILV